MPHRKDTIFKNIALELEKIKSLSNPKSFLIRNDSNLIIDKGVIVISKDNDKNCFNFKIKLVGKMAPDFFIFKKLGFNKNFEIESKNESYIIPAQSINSVSSKRFVDSDEAKGGFLNIYSKDFIITKEAYFRLIIEINNDDDIVSIFRGIGYKCGDVFYGGGLSKVIIKEKEYQLFRHNVDEKTYLIIECQDKIDFFEFKRVNDLCLKVIALLSGNWYQNEYYIFSYDTNKFLKGENFYYESLPENVMTNRRLIDPLGFSRYINKDSDATSQRFRYYFPMDILSLLVEKAYKVKEFERSLDLLVEIDLNNSAIIRNTIFYVALETISNLIYKENKKYYSPIKNSNDFTKIQEELKLVIDKYESELSKKEYQVLSKKINYLNSPFNKDKMIKTFEFMNIELPDKLKSLLNGRNLFLHGKTTVKENLIESRVKELNADADRVHLLVAMLLLRYVGYKGHVKNVAAYSIALDIYFEEIDDLADSYNESVYYKLQKG